MSRPVFPMKEFAERRTPFYYYDLPLLGQTLESVRQNTEGLPFCVHYAVKANANPELLRLVAAAGLGADCVSGGEVEACLKAGFPAGKIVYAGVGKADWEIELSLEAGIAAFNVESVEELAVISELAVKKGKTARVALRVNPDVSAHTHAHIATGKKENKFGIPMEKLDLALRLAQELPGVAFIGLHFHIGSQILDMGDFRQLCLRVNEIQDELASRGITVPYLNVGGGLGIDYEDPDGHPVPDFKAYFATFADNLKLREGQTLHFELGRAIVAQCGTLVSRVLYVKQGSEQKFAILDAGMTELMRPALYGSYHEIDNLSHPDGRLERYDVVGPVCESTDVFARDREVPELHRGDLVGLRSAGAYGESMSSHYNLRKLY